jgi:hypothetical protein
MYANQLADRLGISRPIKTRAIAPSGTISIVAETTSAIEPIMAVAMKRRYVKDGTWHFQYIVDATAQRLIDSGVDPAMIESAYDLAEDVERRLEFQAFVQQYVDHGISSTINLPAWGSPNNTNMKSSQTRQPALTESVVPKPPVSELVARVNILVERLAQLKIRLEESHKVVNELTNEITVISKQILDEWKTDE